jgi:hypothetical protein
MGLTSLKTPQKFSVDGLGELGVKNFRLASRFVEGFLLRIHRNVEHDTQAMAVEQLLLVAVHGFARKSFNCKVNLLHQMACEV